jgi:hypothetical protein
MNPLEGIQRENLKFPAVRAETRQFDIQSQSADGLGGNSLRHEEVSGPRDGR